MGNNAAFEDLELDISDMLTDPEAFSERVYKIADDLRAVCKADHSVNGLMAEMKSTAQPVGDMFNQMVERIYTVTDELDIEKIPSAITRVEKLLADLKTMLRDKVIYETASRSSSMNDKRVAHAQYTALREKFGLFVRFTNDMFGTNLQLLPPLTGNYGPQTGTFNYYIFKHETHGEFRNHKAVIDKIRATEKVEISRDQTLMDFIESEDYLPFGWTVTRVS